MLSILIAKIFFSLRYQVFLLLLAPLIHGRTTVVGYLPHYRSELISLLPYELVTDIVYFSVEPKEDGSLVPLWTKPFPLVNLISMARPKGVKVHVCVGGWGLSSGFAHLAASSRSREVFAGNLTAFLKNHRLDGVDIDWEHPKTEKEILNFHKLLVDLKKSFRPHGFSLSVAVAARGNYFKRNSIPFVDRVHVMSYDKGVPHSSYEEMVNDMKHWEEIVPKNKLVAGLPFYGRNKSGKALSFRNISSRFKPSPDSDLAGGYHYNSPKTIVKKAEYIYSQKYAGVMIWELGQDSEDYTLLKSIQNAIPSQNQPSR